MSINTDDTVSLEPAVTEVEVATQRDLTVSSSRDVDVQAVTSTVEGSKKEYSIIGDSLYASVSAEETPFWLTSLIDNAVDTAVASGMVNYDLLVQDVQNAVSALNIAQNTYVEQINIDATINGVITTRLATLNSTFDQTFATKAELSTTVATSESALAQDISDLSVTLNGAITSQVATSQLALATENSALAADILVLTTSIETQNGDIATAISDLQTTSTAYTDATGTGIENRFAYNSEIQIGGNYYKTGFGLNTAVTTGGTGVVGDGYRSEFWIDAEKFKFTNPNQTGGTAPFAIDASGATPQITFNGLVSFSNTTGTPTHTTGSAAPTGTATDGSTYTQTSVTPYTVWLHSGTWKATNDPDVKDDAVAIAAAYVDAGFVTNAIRTSDLATIQTQLDGSITTWFYNYIPTLANAPASGWATDAVKNQHLADLFYHETTGYAYRFMLVSGTYSWGRITDTDVTAALANASTAQDTADSKRRVFVATPTAPYDTGDLWDTGAGIKRCTLAKADGASYAVADWSLITDAEGSAVTAKTEAVAAAAVDATTRVAVITDNIYIANTTSIDGGNIYTGTVTAGAMAANTITANEIAAGAITSDKIDVGAITADKMIIDGNIQFSSTASGVQFGKTSLGDGSAGAFFGRSGSVAGFNISSSTSGIYADSEGTVSLNNVRLYSGVAGDPLEYPNPGGFTANISSLTTAITVIIIGGGGGSCNAGSGGSFGTQFQRAGTSGTSSYIQWYSGQDGTGTLLGTFTGAGGAGTPGGSVGSNRSGASGYAGQASSKAAGGVGGVYGSSSPGASGTFGSGGGGPSGSDTYNNSASAPVNVSAAAGATVSQILQKPIGAQSIKIFVGTGGTGGQGFSEYIAPNDSIQGGNVAPGGNGGDGFVSYADPNSGGIEIDLTAILNRLTTLEA